MVYIPRIMEKEIKKSSKEYFVVAVLGPRQSGKTTVVKKAFPNRRYISMEDLDNRQYALQDPRGFLETYGTDTIIDEVQKTPDLLSYIQTKVDKDQIKGQFILTGSNQLLLEEVLVQSLSGRVSLLRLLPLSLEELKNRPYEHLNELLFKGFYPRLHTQDIRIKNWIDNYIDTYVNKDVRLVKNITDLEKFNTFLKMLAARVGQLVNLESLGNDCDIAQNTVKSWLGVLESGFIIKKIFPYYKNYNKRLIKSPKVFFYDTGVLCRLLSIKNSEELNTHALKGPLFENFIFAEITKYYFNKGSKPPIYYWRDKQGREIDFLLDENILKVIEVKSGQTITQNFFKNINFFKKIVDDKLKSYLVYSGDEKLKREETFIFSWKEIDQVLKV